MDNIGYLAVSRATLLQRATEITSNNVANANTDGYRASRPVFESMLVNTDSAGDLSEMAYTLDQGTFSNLAEGGLRHTGNPFDVALTGDGWFAYTTDNGETGLGRNGTFVLGPQGDLMTAAGHLVLDEGGAPINVPPGSGQISIGRDGTMTDFNNDEIAKIGVFDAPDIASWTKRGDVMMAPRDGPLNLVPAIDPAMSQGFVEGSNVDPVSEMARMIRYQREFESSLNLATMADELRKQTLSKLAPK